MNFQPEDGYEIASADDFIDETFIFHSKITIWSSVVGYSYEGIKCDRFLPDEYGIDYVLAKPTIKIVESDILCICDNLLLMRAGCQCGGT